MKITKNNGCILYKTIENININDITAIIGIQT